MAQFVETYKQAKAWADTPENRERPIIIRHVPGGYWLFNNADDAENHQTAQVTDKAPRQSKYA